MRKALISLEKSVVKKELLGDFIQNSIEQSRSILELKRGILSREDRIQEQLLIANAELFLLHLRRNTLSTVC